jgi:hypothetical protein
MDRCTLSGSFMTAIGLMAAPGVRSKGARPAVNLSLTGYPSHLQKRRISGSWQQSSAGIPGQLHSLAWVRRVLFVSAGAGGRQLQVTLSAVEYTAQPPAQNSGACRIRDWQGIGVC